MRLSPQEYCLARKAQSMVKSSAVVSPSSAGANGQSTCTTPGTGTPGLAQNPGRSSAAPGVPAHLPSPTSARVWAPTRAGYPIRPQLQSCSLSGRLVCSPASPMFSQRAVDHLGSCSGRRFRTHVRIHKDLARTYSPEIRANVLPGRDNQTNWALPPSLQPSPESGWTMGSTTWGTKPLVLARWYASPWLTAVSTARASSSP